MTTEEKKLMTATTHGPTLNWEVAEMPHIVSGPLGHKINLGKTLWNGETGGYLSSRSKDYEILPNGKFSEICSLIAEKHGLTINHFTSSNGGKKVLAAFKRPEQPFKICGFEIENHLILINSHDGTKCFEVGSNNRLHRCDNMFKSTFVEIKIRHNRFMWDEIEKFELAVIGYDETLKRELQTIERFADVKISPQVIEDAKKMVFGAAINGGEISTATANKLIRFQESIDTELAALGNNFFGLWNGVTHYTTHNMLIKERGEYDFPLFDKAATINEKAFKWGAKLVAAN